ncbi:hypothetical protein NPIL_628341 [Nephila pilipes]|uniref:Uncharacterized protein n=1 Tax=Nephila pilipes TaxID=299642 RepID=A0A8X6UNS3_NEPPI|nr:hypothetical protein NPIL_628341 [Nephila pilipes]
MSGRAKNGEVKHVHHKSYFNLFRPLKKCLEVQHFETNVEIQQTILMRLHYLDSDFYEDIETLGIPMEQMLRQQWRLLGK